MTRAEVLKRLCVLVTNVGANHFDSRVSHDCFCPTLVPAPPGAVDESIIQFIEDAVAEKMLTTPKGTK